MQAEKGLNIKNMKKIIYIQLLNEGTKVYRPVPAREVQSNIYEIGGFEIYDTEDEIWEFTPGTYVLVEEQKLNGEKVLIAIQSQSQI